MNKIIQKLQIPGYETKMMIVPRKDAVVKDKKVHDGIQLSLDIDLEPNKQDSEK
ncbi:hypothetical protein ACFFHF_14170 [Robertmurraya beringensis]|uniref:Uncharacterized protein n=1 Tax=Robertmurraya beringensis TaxID=641660 RepID=A0ABV6KTM4_9BACI